MWAYIGFVAALYLGVTGHMLAAEIAADWMYRWHSGLDERMKPVRDAYRAHLQRFLEDTPCIKEESQRDHTI